MADNDQYNDEYQFADLDAINPDAADDSGLGGENIENAETIHPPAGASGRNDIIRKAMIVIGIVILIMVLYKIVESVFSGKKEVTNATAVTNVTQNSAPTPPAVPQAQTQLPSVTTQPQAASPADETKLNQKLAGLESTQQNMQSTIGAVNDQIGNVNTNLNSIVTKLNEMNGVIANLNAKIEEQSKEIEQITIQREQAKRVRHEFHKAPKQYLKYYIQAVIPGRAWLIASNGTTLTVREGTFINGYGMVKLIDPNQGRVSTSSGQVIRFSQEDS